MTSPRESTNEAADRERAAWRAHRREQLRRWATLPLLEQLRALEEMARLADRLASAQPPAATRK